MKNSDYQVILDAARKTEDQIADHYNAWLEQEAARMELSYDEVAHVIYRNAEHFIVG